MGGGANSDFTVGSGAMLTLNFTGTQWANMVRGGLHGPGMVTNLGNFAWSGGRIGDVGSGLFDNQGTFNWNGGGYLTGTLQNERTVTIASLTYFDGVDMSLQDGSLVNNFGTIAETAGTLWTTGSPTITNQFGAVYDLQGDVNIQQAYGGNPVFNNAGTFKKSAGTGTSHVSGITFNNTGSVEVDSGTLVIGQLAMLGSSSSLVVNSGTLRITAAAAPSVETGATATVAFGATLELVGTVSPLTDSSNNAKRADVMNAGTLQIDSGSTQQVGKIDPDGGMGGTVVVADSARLTAQQIVQSTLTIGVGSTVTILPSTSGNGDVSAAASISVCSENAPSSAVAASSADSDSAVDPFLVIQSAIDSGTISAVVGRRMENRLLTIAQLSESDPSLDANVLEDSQRAMIPGWPAGSINVDPSPAELVSLAESDGLTPTAALNPESSSIGVAGLAIGSTAGAPTAVPEPSTIVLAGLAVAAAAVASHRRKSIQS